MATKKTQYSLEEKRAALALADDVGTSEAARRLNIPSGTISRWRWNARQAQAKGQEWPGRIEPRDDDEAAESRAIAESPNDGEGAADGAAELADGPKTTARVARVYTPSQRAQALELAARDGVTKASKALGISRYSIYEWQRKAKLAAKGLPAP